MNDSGSNNEIEDVLASIRRLVSKETTPPPAAPETSREAPAPAADENEFLVLTPSQRISRRVAEVVAARDAATAAGTGSRDLANELARLESSIAELEAVVSPAAAIAASPETEEAPFIEMTDDDLIEERPSAVTLAFRSSYAAEAPEKAQTPVPDEVQATVQEEGAAEPAPDEEAADEEAAAPLWSEPDEIVDNAPEEGAAPRHEEPSRSANSPLPDEAFATPEFPAQDEVPDEVPEAAAAAAGHPADARDAEQDAEDASTDEPPALADAAGDTVAAPEAAQAEDEPDTEQTPDMLAETSDAAHPDDTAEAPMRPTIVRGGQPVLHDAEPEEDDDPDDEAVAPATAKIDEDALRLMVAQLIREELRGVLGERITSNVRKLVRREIQRALRDQTLD